MLTVVQAVLSARVPAEHKQWLAARAADAGISTEAAVRALLADAVESDLRFTKPPPRVIR